MLGGISQMGAPAPAPEPEEEDIQKQGEEKLSKIQEEINPKVMSLDGGRLQLLLAEAYIYIKPAAHFWGNLHQSSKFSPQHQTLQDTPAADGRRPRPDGCRPWPDGPLTRQSPTPTGGSR